jgi:hypothetical protein
MHHAIAFVAAFFVLSSHSAMADDKLPNVSDEQNGMCWCRIAGI